MNEENLVIDKENHKKGKLGYEPFTKDIVLIYDNVGLPSIMYKFSRITNKELFGGSDKPHPMFVIDGEVYDTIYISVYPNTIINGRAYSLPMQKMETYITMEEAEKACFAKGEGWHLLTAMERGFLANLCLRDNTLPHGNTNYGKCQKNQEEKGIGFPKSEIGNEGAILTGSGPVMWNHNHSTFGITDLCGNVDEWCRGLRLMNGELQVCKDNDAAMNIDLSRYSEKWEPITVNKKPVKLNYSEHKRIIITTNDVKEEVGDSTYWKDVGWECDLTEQLKELALYAGEPKAGFSANTQGERMMQFGGSWYNPLSGIFKTSLRNPRNKSYMATGFRVAFYEKND